MSTDKTVLGNSAVMAAGTLVSRLSGYVRGILLAAALGTALHADIFTIANTVPNILYVLLVGGVVNAVLVPQIVRSAKDPDGGAAYIDRIVTLAALFLLVVTVLLTVGAPWVMQLYLDSDFNAPELVEQRQSVIDFARFCLPQVFFYGMFVLVGQILNARGSFAPMFWAPIANNAISVVVLVIYLVAFGPTADKNAAFSANQELVLGIGSTLGIVAQFVILVPFLRAVGVRFRPRFDFRGAGLGHTFRLGTWTIALIVVSQLASLVVVRLASSGTAQGAIDGSASGTGYTIYTGAFLLVLVPHSIVTVSLATAILPRLSASAHDGDLAALASTLSSSLRTALALVIPFAALLPIIALDLASLVFRVGAASTTYQDYAPTIRLLGISLVFFTAHYLIARGYYALERTRTVFWIQCAITVVNIVAAVALVRETSAQNTTPALAVAYTAAYAVGAVLAFIILARILGGLETPRLVRFLIRTTLAAGIASAVAWPVSLGVTEILGDDRSKVAAVVYLAVVAGTHGLVFLGAARAMRVTEVTELVGWATSRIPGLR